MMAAGLYGKRKKNHLSWDVPHQQRNMEFNHE
jgi:hypothetical protein